MGNTDFMIFNSLPVSALLIVPDKADFFVKEANRAFIQRFQVKKNELPGKELFEAISKTHFLGKSYDFRPLKKLLKKAYRESSAESLDTMAYPVKDLKTGKKEIRFSRIEITPVPDEKSNPAFLLLTFPDLNELKVNQAESDFLLNNSLEGMILVNKDLKIVSFNDQFEKLYASYFSKKIKRGDSILDYAQAERKEAVKEIYQKVFKGEELEVEIEVPVSNQQTKYFLIKYRPARNAQDEIIGAIISGIDITEKKQASDQILNSKILFESIVNSIDGIFWEARADDLVFTYVSPQSEKILGYLPEDWYKKNTFWQDHIHEDDRKETIEYCKSQVKSGNDHKFEYRMIDADGKTVWLEDIVSVIKENGKAVKLRGIMIDITKQKEIQADNQKLLKALGERVKEQTCLYQISKLSSSKMSVSLLLSKAVNLLPQGFQLPKFTGASISFDHQTYQTKNFTTSKWKLESTAQTFSGKKLKITITLNSQSTDDKAELFLKEEKQLTDTVTKNLCLQIDQIIANEQIESTSTQLQNIMDQSADMICTLNEEGKFVQVSDASKQLLGYEPEELIGKSYLQYISNKYPIGTDEVSQSLMKNYQFTNIETYFISKTGELVPLIWSIKLSKTDRLAYCIARDGTEKKRTEMALQERNAFVESAIENMPLGISINTIKDGVSKFMNKRFSQVYGWPKESLSDVDTLFKNVYPDPVERKKVKNQILDDIRTKDANRMNWDGITITTKEGKKRIIAAKNIPLYDKGLMISTVMDITEQRIAEEALRLSEERLKGIINSQTSYLIRTDLEGDYSYYNDKYFKDFGWLHQTQDLIGINCMESIMPYHQEKVNQVVEKCLSTPEKIIQVEIDKPGKNGAVRTTLWDFICLTDVNGQPTEIQCAGIDVTARKEAETALLKKTKLLATLTEVVSTLHAYDDWHEALNTCFNLAGQALEVDRIYYFEISTDTKSGKELINQKLEWTSDTAEPQINHPELQNIPIELVEDFVTPLKNKMPFNAIVSKMPETKTKQLLVDQDIVSILVMPILLKNKLFGFVGFDDCKYERDWSEGEITFLKNFTANIALAIERKNYLNEIQKAFKEKNSILESISDAFIAIDKNWLINYFNKEAEDLLSKKAEDVVGQNFWETFPSVVGTFVYEKYHLTMHQQKAQSFEYFYPVTNAWYEVNTYPSTNGLTVYFRDITSRKKTEQILLKLNASLKKQAMELEHSNKELEQFAYVASHDLQEPLRMVSSFLTKIEEKYDDKLDERGRKYIELAVDGAKRMKRIILDLLEYSRSGKIDEAPVEIDVNELMEEMVILHRKTIEEKNAVIKWENLPIIKASKAPIHQLFRNLIGNALKYASLTESPLVVVKAVENSTHWLFSVSDNGIGIHPEFHEKIFNIFQRLHDKNTFEGSGIGLAICKKIVEFYDGKISVESNEGEGATFSFSISKNIHYN